MACGSSRTHDFGNGDAAASETPQQESVDKAENIPTELHKVAKRPQALPEKVNCEYTKGAEPAAKENTPPANGEQPSTGTVPLTLGTSIGDLKLNLDRSLAPCTVDELREPGEAEVLRQHDVPPPRGDRHPGPAVRRPGGHRLGGPGYSFKDEVFPELTYGRGVLAMANAGPDTNGSQFFIVYGDGSNLQPKYNIFGTLDEDSLKKIDEVAKTGTISRRPARVTASRRPRSRSRPRWPRTNFSHTGAPDLGEVGGSCVFPVGRTISGTAVVSLTPPTGPYWRLRGRGDAVDVVDALHAPHGLQHVARGASGRPSRTRSG